MVIQVGRSGRLAGRLVRCVVQKFLVWSGPEGSEFINTEDREVVEIWRICHSQLCAAICAHNCARQCALTIVCSIVNCVRQCLVWPELQFTIHNCESCLRKGGCNRTLENTGITRISLAPPTPNPSMWIRRQKYVNKICEILTTKVRISTYFGMKIHFGEIVN